MLFFQTFWFTISIEKKTNTDLLNLLLIIYIFDDILSLKKNNKAYLVHDIKEITHTPKHTPPTSPHPPPSPARVTIMKKVDPTL